MPHVHPLALNNPDETLRDRKESLLQPNDGENTSLMLKPEKEATSGTVAVPAGSAVYDNINNNNN